MRSVRAELLSSTGWFGSVHASEFEAELTRRSALRLSESRERVIPRVEALGRSLATAAMPSVGMRRTTRVFGVVKGADGARVLRSGRRLWPDSAEIRLKKHSEGEDWLKLVKNDEGGGGGKAVGGFGVDRSGIVTASSGWSHSANRQPQRSVPAPVVEIEAPKPEDSEAKAVTARDKLFGIVYVRKRKGLRASSDGKKDGILFTRRKKRRLNSGEGLTVADEVVSKSVTERGEAVNVVCCSPPPRNCFAAHFLWIVLAYMTREKLRISDLFAFLTSQPISCIFSSSGLRVFLDRPLTWRPASCKIFGAVKSVPLFSVDFSAVPLCFMSIYWDMFFQHRQQLSLLNNATEIVDESDDEVLENETVTRSDDNNADNGWVSNPSLKGSKFVGRSAPYRSGLLSRGIRKRRSSLRQRRVRNPSLGGVQKPIGFSDLVSFRKNSVSLSVMTNNKVRRSLRSSSVRNLKQVSSVTDGLAQDKDSTSCCANILVILSDRCYREEGANIELDVSPLGEWVIAVKKDGSTKFTHKTEKFMRAHTSNRYTHAIMWNVDNDCKLEFPNRRDWTVFKDLYKECSDRNMPVVGVKSIPIPGVNEVSQTGDGNKLFRRPDSYISVKDNELQRALTRKHPTYDMDSDDELWLEKFNKESSTHDVPENNFELMVDAFEKAVYCSQLNPSDEKPPADFGLHLGSRNAVEAVYSYWMGKRKKNSSTLRRIFQIHPEMKPSLVINPLLRKKRSFKRQPSQIGRGKHHSLLRGKTVGRGTVEEQNEKQNVEAAKITAKISVETAISKRRRAQVLMNNVDLATYKATMALRIAEGAALTASTAAVADHLLD